MNPIEQEQLISFLKDYPNKGVMIPVYGHTDQFGADTFFQCIIAPVEFAQEDMERDDTNRWPSSLLPGFTQYGFGDDAETVYSRYTNDMNIEPFIIVRDYEGSGIKRQVEIVEEFRLLNNLYFDSAKNEYRDLESDVVVVKITGTDFVYVDKRFLKRYLSVKSSAMLVQIDSRYSAQNLTRQDTYIEPVHNCSDFGDTVCTLTIDTQSAGQRIHSLLYSKSLISGVSIKDCGYWPYNSIDRKYEDFILGLDGDGKEQMFSSNPRQLNNYFDANPDAPMYLTPVFFKREVLKKYYDNPVRYSIVDGALRCGTKWILYIDNQHDDYVSAYLGDLGRDLPDYQEQQHWRSYNIAVDGSISNSKLKRDFYSLPADPDSPVFLFQNEYRSVNSEFESSFGWPLFLPLHGDDEYNYVTLRLPLSNAQSEFDSLVLALVKVLIDSLNESKIKACIPEETTGSISRLEKWMEISSIVDYHPHIKYLRNLQQLRSSSTAHRKGDKYEKTIQDLSIYSSDLRLGFKSLIIRATEFLKFMKENFTQLRFPD